MTAASNLSIIKKSSPRALAAVGALIFLLAFGVRILSWHDTRLEVGKVQTVVTADYKRIGQLLREGGIRSFFSRSSPLADLNNLGHPPGYSMLIALVGSADARIQFMQMICDALAAVMIFLIVAELLSPGAGAAAGLLAAFSPQFAWNSVLLLPDSISVLPILVAVYLIARAVKKPRLLTFIIAGALIGISCWLRANAMLLTLFVALAVLVLINAEVKRANRMPAKGRGWRFALAVVGGTLLVILPLTIRNAIVFHRFIPLSLGAGQTFLEGIADYDREGRFGIPATDMGIMKQESEMFGRPDYYGTLFRPDGVERERARISRGFAVVRAHPLWFAGVMARRASSMVRLERARLIATDPPVSHSFDRATMRPVWLGNPDEFLKSPKTQISREPGTDQITLVGDDSKYGEQFAAGIAGLKQNTDYVLVVPVKVERGRIRVGVTDFGGQPYSSAVVEALEQTRPEDQPLMYTELPFVTRSNQKVQLLFRNEASNPPNPSARFGPIAFYELGPAQFLWTRYPRFVIHGIQKIFLTAVILPFAIIGLVVLIFRKQSRPLVILSMVPIYFFTVQSIVHTEYRYVLAVDYSLFAFAGVAIVWIGAAVIAKVRGPRSRVSLR